MQPPCHYTQFNGTTFDAIIWLPGSTPRIIGTRAEPLAADILARVEYHHTLRELHPRQEGVVREER